MADKTIYLLDAYALAYRAYYAFIKNPLKNSKGMNTSAVFGFTNSLLQLLQKENPSHIGVVFDPHGPTFRHEMYDQYKANREAMPEDMRESIPIIKEVIVALNIPIVQLDRYEADDLIGTLAYKAKSAGLQVFMMTPDKDYAQLVTDGISVYKPGRSGDEHEIWNADKVREKFGVEPSQIIDLLGLMGDASDNIPGCPGVGPKSAEKLIKDFGSIEGIYQNIDQLKGKQKENFEKYREQVELSKVLATIDRNAPIEFNAADFERKDPDKQHLNDLFAELEFQNRFAALLGLSTQNEEKQVPKKPSGEQHGQGSLFDFDEPELFSQPVDLKDITTEKPNYVVAQSSDEQEQLCQLLLKCSEVCFDTETTSLNTIDAQLVAITFATAPKTGWMVVVPDNQTEAQATVERFRPFFENEAILKIGQNMKYDIQVLMNYGVEVRGKLFDTMIAHYLLQPEQRHGIDLLAETYLGYKKIKTEELMGKHGDTPMRNVELNRLRDYACEDADIALQLKNVLQLELEKVGMLSLLYNVETPLIPVLAKMEHTGVKIDSDALNEYAETLRNQAIKIEQEIHQLAGVEFNVASPKQLGEVLYERLQIVKKPPMTKTKQYSTAEDVLEKLADNHPIVKKILDYRSTKKMLSTYAEALPKLVNEHTGRIHTSYNQAVTATGRLSSNNPNLQNIPVREAEGKLIRKAFIASQPNGCLIAADYSQIELRLMAHLSQDPLMVDAFRNEKDIHSETAAKLFHTTPDQVTREQRSRAKGANFGIIYGISSFGLSQNIGIKLTEAKEIIDNYFVTYPKVKEYMDTSIAVARQNGYAETICHRRRYLGDLQSANSMVRSAAERNAINAPIQGSAADIIKIAMINIDRRLTEMKLRTKMIMQVHDELIFDVAEGEKDIVSQMVKQEMEGAVQLSVPLTVDVGVGHDWLQAH